MMGQREQRRGTTLLTLFVFITTLWAPYVMAQTPEAAAPAAEAPKKPTQWRVGVLAVPARRSDKKLALPIQALFRNEVTKLLSTQLVVPTGDSDLSELVELRGMVDRGNKLLRGTKFSEAMPLYQEAADRIGMVDLVPDRRLLARLYKGLAICQWIDNNKEAARSNAQRSRHLWPNQSDVEWAFNMETSRLFRDVTVGWETTPNGEITIKTSPSDAEVFVDGVSRGFSPVTVAQASVGPHHVFVVRDGYMAHQSWVVVESEQQANVKVGLKAIPNKSGFDRAVTRLKRASSRAHRALKNLNTLAKAHGGVDVLIAVTVRGKRGALELRGAVYKNGKAEAVRETLQQDAFLISNMRGLVRTWTGVDFGPDLESEPLEGSVARDVAGPDVSGANSGDPTYIMGGKDVFAAEQRAKTDTLFNKWWFWAGAAVLVGGAVTAIVVLAGDTGPTSPTGSVSIDLYTPSVP
ncbi:MAG: hypothetical protein CMH54_03620 [Myxococcales bacterium]|nr:hypothetical protein [Myxococcales bacterium]